MLPLGSQRVFISPTRQGESAKQPRFPSATKHMPTEPLRALDKCEDSTAVQSNNDDQQVFCTSPLSKVDEDRQVPVFAPRAARGLPPRPPACGGPSAACSSFAPQMVSGGILLRSGSFEATGQRATHEDATCVRDNLEDVRLPGLRAFYAVRLPRLPCARRRLWAWAMGSRYPGVVTAEPEHRPANPRCMMDMGVARRRISRPTASWGTSSRIPTFPRTSGKHWCGERTGASTSAIGVRLRCVNARWDLSSRVLAVSDYNLLATSRAPRFERR